MPRFIANAQDIPNKWTITVSGTWATADTATITINEKNLTVTIGAAATIPDVIAALVAAFNGDDEIDDETRNVDGSDIPEFTELTAGEATATTFTLIGDVAGVPHVVTVSEATVGTGALAIAETTAATGKSWWNNVDNWDGGAVPISTDAVYYDNTSIPILYGLAQSAVTLTSMTVANLLPGAGIGLPKWNANGYHEWRATELAIGITTLRINDNSASRIKINLGSVANTTEIANTGFGEDNMGAVQLRGSSIGTLETNAGSVDVARFGGETATVTTLRNSGATVYLGDGVATITTLVQTGGVTTLRSAVTTMTVTGGILTLNGSATVGTLTVSGATVNYRSSGTATTVVVGRDGVIDASGDPSARTFSSTTFSAGSRVRDPHRSITHTAIARGTDVQELTAA